MQNPPRSVGVSFSTPPSCGANRRDAANAARGPPHQVVTVRRRSLALFLFPTLPPLLLFEPLLLWQPYAGSRTYSLTRTHARTGHSTRDGLERQCFASDAGMP